jgi:hypothetical protein
MSPRRLLPLLAVLLVLGGAYFAARWHQGATAKRRQDAQKLFQVQAGDITQVVLKRGQEEVHLTKQGNDWRLTKPLADRADPLTLTSLTTALAGLQQDRELGEDKDLNRFGLETPAFIIEFTASGQTHRVAFGSRTPGEQGFYARKDQAPQILIIAAGAKQTLDRTVKDLRDKTLLEFTPDQVKSLKIRVGQVNLELKKIGENTWQWVGRENLKIRADRVEMLLRTLHLARVQEFVEETPRDLKNFGLDPKSAGEVTVAWDKGSQTLVLGLRQDKIVFARRGAAGPVVQVDKGLLDKLEVAGFTLEDRRLWSGEVHQVAGLSWGTPPQLWQARKDKDFWNFTGPAQEAFKQPAARLEAALLTFQRLEYERLLPGGPAPEKPAFVLELADAGGKPLFRLEEAARPASGKVEVRLTVGDRSERAVIPLGLYEQFQKVLQQLATPPK